MIGRPSPRRVLVWQWGRYGAGPRVAVLLAEGLRAQTGVTALLSLSRQTEILSDTNPPICDLQVGTYRGLTGFLLRAATAPLALPSLYRRVRALAPDLAVCAMPGPLDLLMVAALRLAGVPVVVMVHDADAHLGDGLPGQMWLQRQLCRRADWLACLSHHVGDRLRAQGVARRDPIRLRLPPIGYDVAPPAPHGGPLRLLYFGRLRPYKGLPLLTEALRALGPRDDLTVRVVGSGPESGELTALRQIPGVSVENRWVPEHEVGALLSWADALILPYREASQSGVAAVALAAGRAVVATRVGGLTEQLGDAPRAILCDPTAADLARGIRRLIEQPPPMGAPAPPPATAWQAMAGSLLAQVSAAGR